MSSPEPNGGPTARRLQLGARLRGLREARGFTRAQAGDSIRSSESKISRLELGRVGFKERDVADLLRLYGVSDAEHDELLALMREANAHGWWHEYSDVISPWFLHYLDLEQAAELIRTYEVQFVPGLLQTADYARAVIALAHEKTSPAKIDRRVALRVARARILNRPDPPRLWAVIDEAVLHRPIGGPAVLRAQIEALLTATALPNVQLQVVPFGAGGHTAAGGAFSILRFADHDLSDVVYLEHLTNAQYLDKQEDLDLYSAAVAQLFIEAEEPQRTPDILRQALRALDG
ncbi:helix-turn-helix domain-containing protein [Cryptosporangium sp. NPDC051539]|uniref:helix-turn-helix domain-containing protein n=1 Tax=Cryptosporangium sp. NPDC051539 TaxID=3363962 RepID=UPI0037AC2736